MECEIKWDIGWVCCYYDRYSESLYALFSFGGLYYLVTGGNTIAVVSFALSGWARSNGVLNAGYFCFQTMHRAYDALFLKKRACVSFIFLDCLGWG